MVAVLETATSLMIRGRCAGCGSQECFQAQQVEQYHSYHSADEMIFAFRFSIYFTCSDTFCPTFGYSKRRAKFHVRVNLIDDQVHVVGL